MTTEMKKIGAAGDVLVERRGNAGLITLNRPKALNALSLQMVRDLLGILRAWRDDPEVRVVAIRGTNKIGRPGTPDSLFGCFCAGGDIRFFHQAALAGDAALDDFFTEEYTLNHLIQTYPKPFMAFMDGVVMGGGMGLSQGARVRIVTERTRMAMPETNIGLFPDVGAGYFLSRCPGHVGEYLALTGETIGADEAIGYGLADVRMDAAALPALWAELGATSWPSAAEAEQWVASKFIANTDRPVCATGKIDTYFSLLRVKHIVDALEKAKDDRWAAKVAVVLRKRSPLMLHVTLEQIRRARSMTLADDLRMERDMVYQCFHLRPGAESVEGIRALAVDKDYQPKWQPARIEDVKPGMADAFFASPWSAQTHPLRDL
ncbi:enoyl-CoA hydratase/isomerase family protein [Polaromonas naphthalenivorans]|uniref:Enoyl-CoA hydratase/isomerase n=1 Tax=Polaromonas naphthalenivorans (strain CJ2) TaxID=365044 RepID=A1VNT7_POLNA|nr:enoyl-CoA hydratase/isomerase family protein [Polaromonas naphthalenivorans]ABM37315.1 Enoyl-CoA hydratase/isomerase [Polaromonas naphthalenivorans CJ2]